MKQIQLSELSDESINKIADKMIEKILEIQVKEENEIFYNTKILLRHYQKLKAFTGNFDDKTVKIKSDFWIHNKLTLDFLNENRAKTKEVMHCLDTALNHYEKDCMKEKREGFKVLQHKYITSCWSDEEIGEFYNVDRTTIVKWTKVAIKDLSIYLYGIEALRK